MKPSLLFTALLLAAVVFDLSSGRRARKARPKLPRVNVKLLRVLDGDTADVEDPSGKKIRVRFRYIDAPEKAQPFGQASKQFLTDIASQKLQLDAYKVDLYGRTIGELYAGDLNLNKAMVDNGYAWCYRNKCPDNYKAGLELATEEKIGLWADEKPQSPWDYRKSRRKPKKKPKLTKAEEIIAALKKLKDSRKDTEIFPVDLLYVSDGDTVTVTNQKTQERMKIRMIYIDAPESSQEGGQASKNFLKKLLEDKVLNAARPAKLSVRVYGVDNYGRYLGVLRLNRTDVNKMMVKEGHAWCYKTGCPSGYLTGLKKARKAGKGLWAENSPKAPWLYRAEKKAQG